MRNRLIITGGKSLSQISKKLNVGHGSTWPGHMALKANPRFIEEILSDSQTKVIMVAGTNGKTTTSRIIRTILEENNTKVIHNESGANLLNGIASTLLLRAGKKGKITAQYAIFEVDENALPHALAKITPDYLIILNLFRDQLDRYGEVSIIAKKWQDALDKLTSQTVVLLNADDPQVAFLGEKTKAKLQYFGLTNKSGGTVSSYSADSLYCPQCGTKLHYSQKTYSHLGKWSCPHCGLKRPDISDVAPPYLPLSGTYNEYNTTAAVLLASLLSFSHDSIDKGLRSVTPAFGRQEIIDVDGKKVQLFLSKNPTGFNESLRTITDQKAKNVMFVLNDRVADGHDVSWIWDVDFESFIQSFDTITVSGDRWYDVALRMKYSDMPTARYSTYELLQEALRKALAATPDGQMLYILPTYTAMLEVRKILKGRSIL
jgi:UDP-N-acetylmuramyl tripeptide synthase